MTQKSILGPLLFLVYVNDIPSGVRCKTFVYVDDIFSSELGSIREWLVDDKLSLNLGKTESILSLPNGNPTNIIPFGCTVLAIH